MIILFWTRQHWPVMQLSWGIRVRISQNLDVVAFCSWNLNVVVFQSWNSDVASFCPLKKSLRITMSWFNCLHFSMLGCFSPESWCCVFLVWESWCRGLLVLGSWCHGVCVSQQPRFFMVRTEKSRKLFGILLKNISIIQINATAISIKYAQANWNNR